MNRINKLTFGLLLTIGSVWAQTQPISSIRILTEPQGARFYVDGLLYYSAQVFLWPAGSKHTLQFPLFQTFDGTTANYQLSLDNNIQYVFGGWLDDRGLLSPGSAPTQVITADPKITQYKATLTFNYRMFLRFSTSPTALPTCGGAPGDPPQDAPRAGLVYVNGSCYGSNADLFFPAGPLTLNAFPYPGWVFVGWSVNGSSPAPSLTQFQHAGSDTVNAIFELGKRVKFVTEPFGLQVLVDRTPTPTSAAGSIDITLPYNAAAIAICTPDFSRLPPIAPATMAPLCLGEFDFYPGSAHTIGAPSPQYDRTGKVWVFDSFSNGVAANGEYRSDRNTATRDIISARFAPGVKSSITTNFSGLKVSVDGRDNWGSYNFVWAAGSKHRISAPASQILNGRRYTFKSWSNGGPADQEITLGSNAENFSMAAIFEVQPQVTLRSNPPGITLTVDGKPCKTPCVLDRDRDSSASISAPAQIPQNDLQRLDLTGWADAPSASRTVTFNADTQVLTVNYNTSFRFSLIADPAGSATFQVTPASADNFYPSGAVVTVVATAQRGFKFRRFEGDLLGTASSGSLTMLSSQAAVAYFDKAPFIAAAGIKNAAGDTPEAGLAPNSVFALYGDNLVGEFQVGNTNPLSQTIGGAVVVLKPGDRILPLLFVSPSQINGVLPSDLAEGSYTMRVQWQGQDVPGEFKVVRNAPGLFTTAVGSSLFVVATRADGSVVTPDNPAAKGETINVYGTGFGPYDKPVVDGFTIPGFITYRVVDLVQATIGDLNATVVSSQAAADLAGTTLTRIVIPANAPSGSIGLTVRANGKSSNAVLVPVQ